MRRLNSSHRLGLIALGVGAMLAPVLILAMLQYRSLTELESKTRVAGQEQLRQLLQRVTQRAQEELETLATKALGGVSGEDIEQMRLAQLEQQLVCIRAAHPEIELAFIVSHCACRAEKFALFASRWGVRRVGHEQFKQDEQTQTAVRAWTDAGLLQATAGTKQRVYFEQTHCSALSGGAKDQPETLVFLGLPHKPGQGQGSFIGVALKPEFVQQILLPAISSEVLRGSNLALSVYPQQEKHQRRRAVFASTFSNNAATKQPEVTLPFTPVFRQWALGIGYANTTIAELARQQFQQNLVFTGLALMLLLGGMLLTLRATAREVKLAQAKSTFVSNVSHELKTPLALIRLFAETLELGRVKSAEKGHEYHRIIHHESRRLTQLINNILDFSRIEAGRREYRFAETEVAEVVVEVLQSYEYQLASAGFAVTAELRPNLRARLDRDALAQAVLNLLSNAVKYSADAKRLCVRVSLRGSDIAIEVIDYGIGIPRAEHRKIFEQFYRVGTGLVHDTKGSGLGLTIVQHIVAAHGGRMLVESALGQGSVFTILLPALLTETAAKRSLPAGGYSIAENPHH